jgi:hypothetical protein
VGIGFAIPGWCCSAALRYVDFTSSAVADSLSLRTSYGLMVLGGLLSKNSLFSTSSLSFYLRGIVMGGSGDVGFDEELRW